MKRRAFAAILLGVTVHLAPAREITTAELEKYLEDKRVFFLDVREPEEIRELGSVPGYVNIPVGQLESRLKEIPKDKLIITL
jgi:rhodanese-related sulfurtransferase